MAEFDFNTNTNTRQINQNLPKSKSTDSIMNTINKN